MQLSELHTFQHLHSPTWLPYPANLQRTRFACGRISFPNAGADLLCLATPSPIGSKRSVSCWLRLGAKLEKSSSKRWKVLWLIWPRPSENGLQQFETRKAAVIMQNTWIDCAPSQRKSIGCKSRFRHQPIRGWCIISIAKATIRRLSISRRPSFTKEHRHFACVPSGFETRTFRCAGQHARWAHRQVLFRLTRVKLDD